MRLLPRESSHNSPRHGPCRTRGHCDGLVAARFIIRFKRYSAYRSWSSSPARVAWRRYRLPGAILFIKIRSGAIILLIIRGLRLRCMRLHFTITHALARRSIVHPAGESRVAWSSMYYRWQRRRCAVMGTCMRGRRGVGWPRARKRRRCARVGWWRVGTRRVGASGGKGG